MNRTFADTDSQGEGLVVTMAAETGVRDCKPASAGVAGAARSEGTSFVEPRRGAWHALTDRCRPGP